MKIEELKKEKLEQMVNSILKEAIDTAVQLTGQRIIGVIKKLRETEYFGSITAESNKREILSQVISLIHRDTTPAPEKAAPQEKEYCEWREYTDEQGQYYLTECHKNRAVMPFYKIPENNKCLCGKPIKVKEV